MSLDATRWARRVRGIGLTAKLVLILLADHADDTGLAWPSLRLLAEDGCMSERAARNAVRELEQAGVVITEQRMGLVPRYRLRMDTPAPDAPHPGTSCPPTPAPDAPHPGTSCPPTPAPDAPHPGTSCPPTPAPDAPHPGTSCPPTPAPDAPHPGTSCPPPRHEVPPNHQLIPKEPKIEKVPAGSAEPAGFAEFWQAYPRKVAKSEGMKVYAKALKDGAKPAELLAGLRRFKFADDPQFIPYPATWLNRGHWQDEGTPDQPGPRGYPTKSYAGCL